MKTLFRRLPLLALCLLVLGAAPALHAQREKFSPADMEVIEKKWPGTKRTYTGLRYLILKPGEAKGPSPEAGMLVTTLYKGMLMDGTVFDQAQDPKRPFRTRVGRDELIRGWDEALMKMHKGEKWLLIVPFELAYGTLGRPPSIPRESALVFELELVDFSKN